MIPPRQDKLNELVRQVKALATERFPESFEGAAGMLLENGTIVTSTAPTAANPSVEICHETGAYCEAFKRRKNIVASVCLHHAGHEQFVVLSPCGVCMERLAVHGPEVSVGVPAQGDSTEVSWVPLKQAHPFYWRKAFSEETPGW